MSRKRKRCEQVIVARWEGEAWDVVHCLEEAIHFIEGRGWYCNEHHHRHRHHHHEYCTCEHCCK